MAHEDHIDGVEFVNEREREVFARAVLGQQVQDFLVSPVGRYLHGRAKLEIQQVQEQLLTANLRTPWGRRKAERLQQSAERAETFMKWLADAIIDGENAARDLDE